MFPLFLSLMLLLQNPSPAAVAGGVKVSGKVVGLTAESAATIVLQSFEKNGPAATARVNADGSFEFKSVPKGIYSASLRARNLRMGGLLHWYLAVDNQDIHSLEFRDGTGPELQVSSAGTAPIATGTVILRDDSGRRIDPFPAGILIQFMSSLAGTIPGSMPSITSIGRDGSFSVPACCGKNMISFVGLPPGYSIQSMSSNGVDLLKSPLVVEGWTPPAAIQIVLEYRRP